MSDRPATEPRRHLLARGKMDADEWPRDVGASGAMAETCQEVPTMAQSTRRPTEATLRALRSREDAWSLRRMDAEDAHGPESPQERAALERATDYAVEADMVEEWLDSQHERAAEGHHNHDGCNPYDGAHIAGKAGAEPPRCPCPDHVGPENAHRLSEGAAPRAEGLDVERLRAALKSSAEKREWSTEPYAFDQLAEFIAEEYENG